MNKRQRQRRAVPVANDWGSRRHVQTLVLMAATVGGIYLCYLLSKPFLPALTWALALAILCTPLQRWLEAKVHRPSIAATISTLMAALMVVAAVTLVSERLIAEAAKGAEVVRAKVESGEWRRAIEIHPRIAPSVEWIEQQIDLPEIVRTVTSWLTSATALVVRGSVVQLIGFLLTFYLLFYFLRDRRAALEALQTISPLSPAETDRLMARVCDTIYAILYGTLVVAAVQGALAGLMFWWLGLPAPLLWGIIMGLLSVVPLLGPFVVWIPTVVILALEGSWGKALVLTIWGSVVVGGIDNLLHPILVGNRLRLHSILAFISVVGGLVAFGPSGLILGPLALTVTLLLLDIWRSRNPET